MTADERERPLRADARRNRARVLDAAYEAFAEVGVTVPLDEIARRAGVGAGTVYRHFPSKEALFEAVLSDRVERLVTEIRTAVATADPKDAFFSFLSRIVEDGVAKKDLIDALMGSGADVAAGTSKAKRALRDLGAELLARAQRADAVRTDVEVADVLALVSGTVFAIHGQRGDAEVTRRMLAVLHDGLRPPGDLAD